MISKQYKQCKHVEADGRPFWRVLKRLLSEVVPSTVLPLRVVLYTTLTVFAVTWD